MTLRSEHSARAHLEVAGLPRRSAGGAKAGYSLAEVLVVLAVIGLIVALVPMGVSRMLPGMRLNAAAEELAQELRTARAKAVGGSEEIRYRVAADGLTAIGEAKTLPLSGVDAFEYWGFDPSGRLTRQDTFRFLSDGSSTGGHFILRAEGKERRVAVHWLFGHVDVQRGEGTS